MKEYDLTVESVNDIDDVVYELVLSGKDIEPIAAGQFAHLKIPEFDLRRPFCVYSSTNDTIKLIVAKVGNGTRKLYNVKKGDVLNTILPIGNGFPVKKSYKTAVLLGGGTGSAPLYKIAKDNPSLDCHAFLGFTTAKAITKQDDFASVSHLTVCTDDGSAGIKGYPSDALNDCIDDIKPDVIYVCGPLPLIKSAKTICETRKIDGYMSGEARMGCGIGACLVCAVTLKIDDKLVNKRACVDGPVFDLKELIL